MPWSLRQLGLRHKSGGGLSALQPTKSFSSFALGCSAQSVGIPLFPSTPEAVEKQFLKLAVQK